MMNRIRERIEDWMAAVAFAEHGDHATARQLIRFRYRPSLTQRRRASRQDRMAARAPLPRS
ncbi:MAG: hypothetical protein ACUVS3_03625 [Thermodesulfobacteriota bacterium]